MFNLDAVVIGYVRPVWMTLLETTEQMDHQVFPFLIQKSMCLNVMEKNATIKYQ